MSNLTKREMVAIIKRTAKRTAKRNGLIFKESGKKISGDNLYELVIKKTKEVLIKQYVLTSAFEDSQSGYISSWNGLTFNLYRTFK